MRYLLLTTLLLTLTFFSLTCKLMTTFPPPLNNDTLGEINTKIEKAMEDHITPGAVCIVGTPNKRFFQMTWGHFAYEDNSPAMRVDTLFDLASLTKPTATASATMLLIEDGRLSLQDPVSKYVPQFTGTNKEKVTIAHLLAHTSGMPPYCTVDKVKEAANPNLPNYQNLINYICTLDLRFEPNTDYTYSCLNFLLLSFINQTVLGTPQEHLLRERVFDPLGMNDTTYYPSPEQKKRAAPTILYDDGSWRQGEVHDPLAHYSVSEDYCPGNAGLFSTPLDMEKYCHMILQGGVYEGKRIFKPQTVAYLTTLQTPEGIRKRSYGWGIYQDFPWATKLNHEPGREVIGHTGYTGTFVRMDKYARNYLILFTNRVYPDDKAKVTPLRRTVIESVVASSPLYQSCLEEPQKETNR